MTIFLLLGFVAEVQGFQVTAPTQALKPPTPLACKHFRHHTHKYCLCIYPVKFESVIRCGGGVMPEVARGGGTLPFLACTPPAQYHSHENAILLLEFTYARKMSCESDAAKKVGSWLVVSTSLCHVLDMACCGPQVLFPQTKFWCMSDCVASGEQLGSVSMRLCAKFKDLSILTMLVYCTWALGAPELFFQVPILMKHTVH